MLEILEKLSKDEFLHRVPFGELHFLEKVWLKCHIHLKKMRIGQFLLKSNHSMGFHYQSCRRKSHVVVLLWLFSKITVFLRQITSQASFWVLIPEQVGLFQRSLPGASFSSKLLRIERVNFSRSEYIDFFMETLYSTVRKHTFIFSSSSMRNAWILVFCLVLRHFT